MVGTGTLAQLALLVALVASNFGILPAVETSLLTLLLCWFYSRILVGKFGLSTWSDLLKFFGPVGLMCMVVVASKLLFTRDTQPGGVGVLKAVYDPMTPAGVKVISEDMGRKTANKGSMIVRVRAVALNPIDFKLLHVKAYVPLLRWVVDRGIASDFAGQVFSAGRDCRFKEGDEIFGHSRKPVLQEYTTMSCDSSVALRPTALSVVQAAGCGVTCITTYDGLVTRRALSQGQRLLVIGASGGCGSLAVSLGKILGAHVTGIASARNADMVKQLGVDEFVDYSDDGFDSWRPSDKFDHVYDTVSSPDPRDPDYEPRVRPWLVPEAIYTAINSAKASDWPRALLSFASGIDLQREGFDLFLPDMTPEKFAAIAELAGQGFVPLIDTVYGKLNDETLRAGVARQLSRRAQGKIVFELVASDEVIRLAT